MTIMKDIRKAYLTNIFWLSFLGTTKEQQGHDNILGMMMLLMEQAQENWLSLIDILVELK